LRKILQVIWIGFLGLSRGLVAWVPPLLVVAFGAIYLAQCLQLLTSPGTGVKLLYEGEGGVYSVTSETYVIDPVARVVNLTDVVIRDENQQEFGRAKQVTAFLAGPSPRVKISDAILRVIRQSDGAFDVLQALPKADPAQPDAALSIEVNRAKVVLVDQTAPEARTSEFHLRNLSVANGAGHTLARSVVELEGGTVPLKLQLSQEGDGFVAFDLKDFDLAPHLPLIKSFLPKESLSQIEPLNASLCRLTGPVRVSWIPESAPLVSADLAVVAEGLSLRRTLANGNLRGTVRTDGNRFRIAATLREPGRSAVFDGEVTLAPQFRVAGNAIVEVDSSRSVWSDLAPLLPKNSSFRAVTYRGWIATDGQGFEADGALSAGEIVANGQKVTQVQAKIATNGEALRADIERATFQGESFTGSLSTNFRRQTLEGAFSARLGTNLLRGQEWASKLQGEALVTALVSGTYQKPIVAVEAKGQASYQVTPGRLAVLGPFVARGTWEDQRLKIDRIDGVSSYGRITGGGTYSEADGIDITLSAYGIDLRKFDERLSGTAFVQAKIVGTPEEPVLMGRVETYRTKFNEFVVPLVSANISANLKTVAASDVIANFGSGSVEGQLVLDLGSGKIEGEFASTGLDLTEFTNQDLNVRFAIPRAVITGSLEQPIVAGRATLGKALIAGAPIDEGSVSFEVSPQGGTLSEILVSIENGRLAGSGTLTFEPKFSASLSGEVTSIPLQALVPPESGIQASGTCQGQVSVEFVQDKPLKASFKGRVNRLEVAGSFLGSGPVSVSLQDDLLAVEGQIGQLSRFVVFRGGEYSLANQSVKGDLEVVNYSLEDLVETLVGADVKIDPEVLRTLRQSSGRISALASFSGKSDELDIDLRSLTVRDLEINGQAMGEIELQLSKKGLDWEVSNLSYRRMGLGDVESVVSGAGRFRDSPDGKIEATLSVTNYDLSALSVLFPELPLASGTLNSTAVISGGREDFIARFSVDLNQLGLRSEEGGVVAIPLTVSFAPVVYDHVTRQIRGRGRALFRGLEAEIDLASIPLAAFEENPSARAEASLLVPGVTLARINQDLGIFDDAKTEGLVTARLNLSGNRSGYQLTGRAELVSSDSGKLPTVTLKQSGQTLMDLRLSAELQENKVALTGGWREQKGGVAELSALADLAGILGARVRFEDALEELPVSGKLEVRNYIISQTLPQASRPSMTTLLGKLQVSGNPRRLVVGGDLAFRDTTVYLPPVFPEPVAGPVPPVEVEFNSLTYRFDENSTLVLPTGRLKALGEGQINGTLTQPEFRGNFLVSEGQIRTATNRIFIDRGALNVSYSAGANRLSVLTDLKGRTSATVRKGIGIFTSYRIDVDMKGDLLAPNGLTISGTSDPPDLSQEDIKAILGERALFQDVLAGIQGGDSGALRSSLFSVAVPSLTDLFTAELAGGLGLDYLAFDYNPFDGPIVLAGKRLGRGFTLEANRQLLPQAVERVKFDVRLTYRVPSQNPFVSNVRWGFGFDQDTPWRISVDYSIRF
jgi:hypothetical protein